MQKLKSIIRVGNTEVSVEYWGELLEQWGESDLNDFLYAEALKQLGEIDDAVVFLSGKASGTLTKNASGGWVDTRNWQANWIESYRK